MSFNPKTGGPAGNAHHALRDIAETLRESNWLQRQKIARGEVPDYDPDAPLRPPGNYQNYP